MTDKLFTQADLENKKVFLRLDLNVTIKDNAILNNERIIKSLPTIKELINKNAITVVVSHLGRPKARASTDNTEFSLILVKKELERLLNYPVKFYNSLDEMYKGLNLLNPGDVVLLENIRFYEEEENNDEKLAAKIAEYFDIYINDAFACSHRKHMSVYAIAKLLPSYFGFLIEDELNNLEKTLITPERPLTAIVGGSKLSTKLEILENLIDKADNIFIGGAMANNFLKVQGYNIGKSLYEENFLSTSENLLSLAESKNCKIILPEDIVIAQNINAGKNEVKYINLQEEAMPDDYAIFDIGHNTISALKQYITQSKTILWNGPLGVFENPNFAVASIKIANHIAALTKQGKLTSVAGGGDVIAAISAAKQLENFTYISTAGGAFLEWIAGQELPGISVIKNF